MTSRPPGPRTIVLRAILALLLVLLPRAARADDTCPERPPFEVLRALVHVDALEHFSRGVVIGEPDLVVVPYEIVEVDKIGSVDAYVRDERGKRHPARLVAADRAHGIALLRTDEPLVSQPLTTSRTAPGGSCGFAVVADYKETDRWDRFDPRDSPVMAADGSPLIDGEGHVIGIVSQQCRPERLVSASWIDALLLARSEGRPARRSWIGYGAIKMGYFELAPAGGAWWGGGGSIAGRYRDLLEGRLDLAMSFLLGRATGVGPGSYPERDTCGEPPCFHGLRVAATPSVGLHLRIGSAWHDLAGPIAIKPSIGWAFVAQTVYPGPRVSSFDSAGPEVFSSLSPGVAVSITYAELAFRARLPRGEVRSPTFEIGVGLVF